MLYEYRKGKPTVTNFIGPYFLDIVYTSASAVHKMGFSLLAPTGVPDPGMDFADIDVLCHDAVTRSLDTIVDALVNVLKVFYSTASSTFDTAILSSVAANSFDKSYLTEYDISVAGSTVAASILSSQAIMTFRTSQGGIFKVNMMSGISTPGITKKPVDYGTNHNNLSNFFTGGAHNFIGRDNGYPFKSIGFYPGENEHYFKTLYRPS